MFLTHKVRIDFLPPGFNFDYESGDELDIKIVKLINEELLEIFPNIKIMWRKDGFLKILVQYEELIDLFTEGIKDDDFRGFYFEDKFTIDDIARDEMVLGTGPYFDEIDIEETTHFKLILKYIFLQKLDGFDGREELIN